MLKLIIRSSCYLNHNAILVLSDDDENKIVIIFKKIIIRNNYIILIIVISIAIINLYIAVPTTRAPNLFLNRSLDTCVLLCSLDHDIPTSLAILRECETSTSSDIIDDICPNLSVNNPSMPFATYFVPLYHLLLL